MRILRDLMPARGAARTLVILTLVQALGGSLFLACSAIFLRRVVGLSPAAIGSGLSLAGLAGLLATVPLTRWAGRIGSRAVLACTYLLLGVVFALYGFVTGRAEFLVLAVGVAVGESAGSPLRASLVYAAVDREHAVTARAQMRTSYNIGVACGGALAAIALATGGRDAFIVVGLLNGLAHLACAVLTLTLRERRPATVTGRTPWMTRSALRNPRFLAVTAVNGALELHAPLLVVGVPLWIVERTHIPAGANSAVLACNTILVVVFQLPLSRGADDLAGAARMLLRGGALVALACPLFLASGHVGALAGFAVLLLGVAALSFGEIAQSAGAWTASLELPPPARQAEYQGVFALGRGIRQFAGPAIVTFLVVGLGTPGWVALAGGFLLLGTVAMILVATARPAVPDFVEGATENVS